MEGHIVLVGAASPQRQVAPVSGQRLHQVAKSGRRAGTRATRLAWVSAAAAPVVAIAPLPAAARAAAA